MQATQPQPGFLHRLRAVLPVFALMLPPAAIADQEPAAAACIRHGHTTQFFAGWGEWASAWRIVPHGSTCNDVNVAWASRAGRVKGQYLQDGKWKDGAAGWEPVRPGRQAWPWPVLVEGLRNGSICRVVGHQRWVVYVTPV